MTGMPLRRGEGRRRRGSRGRSRRSRRPGRARGRRPRGDDGRGDRSRRDGAPRHFRLALELLDPPQLADELLRVGGAAIGRLGEQARHDLARRDRQVGLQLERIARLGVEDLVDERGDRVARKRARARQQLVEHDAEREEVRAPVELLALDLLGRHVRRAADHVARARQLGGRGLGELADPEVGDLDPAVLRHEDVGRLDVAVQHAALVRVPERFGDLADDPDARRQRHLRAGRRDSASARGRRRTPSR